MTKLTFVIHDHSDNYCGMCQPLGKPEYGGVKMHRSIPLQVWNVEGTISDIDETKWVELCSDCLMDATEQNIEVRCNDGKSFPDGFVLFRGES